MNTEPNKEYPGRPNYTGPDSGLAGYVHHNIRYEYCWSFHERRQVIRDTKPANEIEMRLHCLVYISSTGKPWSADWDKAIADRDKAIDKANADRDKAIADRVKARDKAWDKANADRDKAIADRDKARDKAWDKANADRDKANADWVKANADWVKAIAPYEAEIIAEIERLVPDAPWNGKELVFMETA